MPVILAARTRARVAILVADSDEGAHRGGIEFDLRLSPNPTGTGGKEQVGLQLVDKFVEPRPNLTRDPGAPPLKLKAAPQLRREFVERIVEVSNLDFHWTLVAA